MSFGCLGPTLCDLVRWHIFALDDWPAILTIPWPPILTFINYVHNSLLTDALLDQLCSLLLGPDTPLDTQMFSTPWPLTIPCSTKSTINPWPQKLLLINHTPWPSVVIYVQLDHFWWVELNGIKKENSTSMVSYNIGATRCYTNHPFHFCRKGYTAVIVGYGINISHILYCQFVHVVVVVVIVVSGLI